MPAKRKGSRANKVAAVNAEASEEEAVINSSQEESSQDSIDNQDIENDEPSVDAAMEASENSADEGVDAVTASEDQMEVDTKENKESDLTDDNEADPTEKDNETEPTEGDKDDIADNDDNENTDAVEKVDSNEEGLSTAVGDKEENSADDNNELEKDENVENTLEDKVESETVEKLETEVDQAKEKIEDKVENVDEDKKKDDTLPKENGNHASEDVKEEAASDTNDETKKEKTDDSSAQIPFFIPSKAEFHKDLDYHYNRRTLLIGPVKLSDLSNETLSNIMQESDYFEVKFSKDKDGNFQGYYEMLFCDTDTAEACALEIEDLSESGIMVQHLNPNEDIKVENNIRDATNSFKRINNSAINAEKIVVVSQLPDTVKEEMIAEKIPNAKAVLIPTSHITHENKRYAYVEVPDKDEVKKMNGKSLTFGELKCKCRGLEELPSVEDVIAELSKYKSTLKSNRDLSQDALNKINEMHRYGTHYERSDYATEQQKEELKNILDLVRKKTKGGKAKEVVKRPVKRTMNNSHSDMPAKHNRMMNSGHYRSESWGQGSFRDYAALGYYGGAMNDQWSDNYRSYRDDYNAMGYQSRRNYMGW